MHAKSRLLGCIALAGLAMLSGTARASQPANELVFATGSVAHITLSYDEESITFFDSADGNLLIREYMTQNQAGYHARVEQSADSIKISEGGKPLFKGDFSRYVEVYWPASYRGALTVSTTDGNIDLSRPSLSLDSLRIDSTSGTVVLGQAQARTIHLSSTRGSLALGTLRADTIRIETTSGTVCCEDVCGNVIYTGTSGDAEFRSAEGSGSYTASNSGTLSVAYTEVTGDLSFFNKNGSIRVTLPSDLSFSFAAAVKNGSLSTTFQDCLTLHDKTVSGDVGEHPAVAVHAETRNGSIEVNR